MMQIPTMLTLDIRPIELLTGSTTTKVTASVPTHSSETTQPKLITELSHQPKMVSSSSTLFLSSCGATKVVVSDTSSHTKVERSACMLIASSGFVTMMMICIMGKPHLPLLAVMSTPHGLKKKLRNGTKKRLSSSSNDIKHYQM